MSDRMIKTVAILGALTMLNFSENKKILHRPTPSVLRILPGRLQWYPNFVELCKNVTQMAQFERLKIEKNGQDSVINADFELLRTVKKVTKTELRFENCADATKTSCQLFQTWRLGEESCFLLEAKNEAWTPFYNTITPKARCPLLKGKYQWRNGTIDVQKLQLHPIPLERYYWRFRVHVFDPESIVCLEFGARFMRSHS